MNDYSARIQAEVGGDLGRLPRESVVTETARRLIEFFTDGQLKPGDRLPPERKLSESLGVGRSAVREAIAALNVLGLVQVRAGSGTYLRDSASELLPQTLSWGIMLGQPSIDELLEVRAVLETQAAQLAAQRRTPEHLSRMRGFLEQMAADPTNIDSFVDADIRFHVEIALAAGNSILPDLLQSIRALLRVWVERRLADPGHAALALEEHQRVYEAIAAGDAAAATAAMTAHMGSASSRLREGDEPR